MKYYCFVSCWGVSRYFEAKLVRVYAPNFSKHNCASFLFLARWLYFFFWGRFVCLIVVSFCPILPSFFLSGFIPFLVSKIILLTKKPTSNQNKSNQIKTKLVKLVIFVFALRKANNLISPINYHCCFNFTVVTTVLQII